MAAEIRRRLKTIAINAAVLAFGLLVALLLAEGAVRLIKPQQLASMRPGIMMSDDSLAWRVRGNVDVNINTGERPVHFVSDSGGFRSPVTGARPRGDVNLLLIGDSFMQALQVDYPATLGARLEEQLSRALGKKVVVWNAGVQGWDPNQYYIREKQLLAREQYDAVVVMVYVDNDVIDRRVTRVPKRVPSEVHRLRFPRNLSRAEIIDAIFYPINDFFETRSHLFQLLKTGFDSVLLRFGLAEASFPQVILRTAAADSAWRITADVSADIAKEAERHGAAMVFGIIPAPYQVDPAAFEYYRRGFGLDSAAIDLAQPQRIIDSTFTERGLTIVDPLAKFQAETKAGTALFGTVDRHFSPRGHEVMADALEPVLQSVLDARRDHRK